MKLVKFKCFCDFGILRDSVVSSTFTYLSQMSMSAGLIQGYHTVLDKIKFITLLSILFTLRNGDVAYHEELQAHEPPPSLVPRVHALVMRRLNHNNPILPPIPTEDVYKKGTDICCYFFFIFIIKCLMMNLLIKNICFQSLVIWWRMLYLCVLNCCQFLNMLYCVTGLQLSIFCAISSPLCKFYNFTVSEHLHAIKICKKNYHYIVITLE